MICVAHDIRCLCGKCAPSWFENLWHCENVCMDPLIPWITAEHTQWIHVHLAVTGSWLCAVRWDGDAHQCLSDLEAPILQAYLSLKMKQPLVFIELCGKQRCATCELSGFPSRPKSRCMFLDHQDQSLPTRAAIEPHWETISKGIQIIYQEPAPAASANVNVSSETRLWLDHSRSAALGADGYPILTTRWWCP